MIQMMVSYNFLKLCSIDARKYGVRLNNKINVKKSPIKKKVLCSSFTKNLVFQKMDGDFMFKIPIMLRLIGDIFFN